MRLLVLGHDGQVGWELRRSLAPLGEVAAPPRAEADLERPAQVADLVRRLRPDAVVNAAAYTAVDKAEEEPARANLVNGESVGAIAEACAATGAWMVHYSTDYVFDGTGSRPWEERDATRPVNAYGRSKLAGEEALRAALPGRHLLLRTSWVYASRGHNFVRTILRLAAERDSLRVIADQFGVPTAAEFLADATAIALPRAIAGAAAPGTYHLVPRGETTWHGIATAAVGVARELGAAIRTRPGAISAIPSSEYPLPAPRPSNSRMRVDRAEAELGIRCPDWRVHLDRAVTELVRGADA